MKDLSGLFTRRGFYAASAGLATLGFSRLAVAAEGETGAMITQLAKFKLNLEKTLAVAAVRMVEGATGTRGNV